MNKVKWNMLTSVVGKNRRRIAFAVFAFLVLEATAIITTAVASPMASTAVAMAVFFPFPLCWYFTATMNHSFHMCHFLTRGMTRMDYFHVFLIISLAPLSALWCALFLNEATDLVLDLKAEIAHIPAFLYVFVLITMDFLLFSIIVFLARLFRRPFAGLIGVALPFVLSFKPVDVLPWLQVNFSSLILLGESPQSVATVHAFTGGAIHLIEIVALMAMAWWFGAAAFMKSDLTIR